MDNDMKKEVVVILQGNEKDGDEKEMRRLFLFPPKTKLLGVGSQGIVQICHEKHSWKQYACKSLEKRKDEGYLIRREVIAMREVRGHSNIVRVHKVFEGAHHVHIIMDLCEGGDLLQSYTIANNYPLYSTSSIIMREEEARHIMKQVTKAVAHCHALGYVHRDIKLENILLSHHHGSPQKVVKLSDFGLACKTTLFFPLEKESSRELEYNIVGTPPYIAPEVYRHVGGGVFDSPKCDVWSLGVTLFALLSGFLPFWDGLEPIQLEMMDHPWTHFSPQVKDLLTHMLCPHPHLRFSANQVLLHPWMRSVSSKSLNLVPLSIPMGTPCNPLWTPESNQFTPEALIPT